MATWWVFFISSCKKEIKMWKSFSDFITLSIANQYQHYNQLTGLRPTQEQLGIHRTHRDAELQGHVVSVNSFLHFCTLNKFYINFKLKWSHCVYVRLKRTTPYFVSINREHTWESFKSILLCTFLRYQSIFKSFFSVHRADLFNTIPYRVYLIAMSLNSFPFPLLKLSFLRLI